MTESSKPFKKKLTPKEDYLNEYARYMMAHVWIPASLEGKGDPSREGTPAFQHALDKGWWSKTKDEPLAPGYKAAAAFLRR